MVNTAVNSNIYAGRKPGSKYNQSHTFQQKEVLEVPDGAAVNKYANVQEIYEALKYNASYRVDKQEQDEIADNYYLRVPTVGTLIYFIFTIFAPCDTD